MLRAFVLFIARIALASLFLWSLIGKILFYEEALSVVVAKFPRYLWTSSLVECLGSFSLIAGYRTRIGALLLVAMTCVTMVFFHDFWNKGVEDRQLQAMFFFNQLSILGGLLYVAVFGPGPLALRP